MPQVYVDESGNLGRGGRYFVLAAVVFAHPEGAKRASRIIHNFQGKLMKLALIAEREEIKSCRLTFPQRQELLNKLVSQGDVDIFYLAVDKQRVTLLNERKPKNLIYNYFAKILTDQIFPRYDDDYRVIFDKRTTSVKSMNSLTDYLTINAYALHDRYHCNVQVYQRDSRDEYNLQIADLVAGTVFQAYTRQNHHFLTILRERIVNADEFPRANFIGSFFQRGVELDYGPQCDTINPWHQPYGEL